MRLYPHRTKFDFIMRSNAFDVYRFGFKSKEKAEKNGSYVIYTEGLKDIDYLWLRLRALDEGYPIMELLRYENKIIPKEYKQWQKVALRKKYINKTFHEKVRKHFNLPVDKNFIFSFNRMSTDRNEIQRIDKYNITII